MVAAQCSGGRGRGLLGGWSGSGLGVTPVASPEGVIARK